MDATENARPVAISSDDPRVVRALEEYASAVEAGRRPNRPEFQARYPDIATALAECLDGLEFVEGAAPQLAHPAAGRLPGSGSATEFWPADALGDYRIVAEIGRGGMGVVYEVIQVSLGRRVALKVLPFAAALDVKQLQRFKNEALAAAQLHHQNIVPVYGVGCERGVHYYAMQYIDGQTLAALIGELRALSGLGRPEALPATLAAASLAADLVSGRWAPTSRDAVEIVARNSFRVEDGLPRTSSTESSNGTAWESRRAGTPHVSSAKTTRRAAAAASTEQSTKSPAFFRTAASLGVQAAVGLEHAHALGVVHRDVKPANLLLDLRGNLWVTDFGLAHCQSQAGLTMTGDLMGTLRYMSPEQALGQRVLLDHRTDVYSLGATLYELLTLEPVFDGRDHQELLRQIASDEPRRPRSLNKAIPAELETIVLKAMEKNPADRYDTAQHMADDLGRYLKDEPIRARPPTLVHKLKKWTRRHSAVVQTATAMLALLLVTVTVGAVLAAWRLNGERDATRDQLQLTQRAEAEATRRLYRSLVDQARANRLTHRMGQRFTTLDILAEASQHARAMDLREKDMLELRNEAIACLALPDMRVAKEWKGWPAGSMTMCFDDALERYARIDRQGVVSVRRVADDAELWRLSAFGPGDYGPGKETYPLFSPDGQFLSLERGEQLKVWNLAESKPRLVIKLTDASGTVFNPDNRELAVALIGGGIDLYDPSTGLKRKQITTGTRAYTLAYHPHARQLAWTCAEGVQVSDLESGSVVARLEGSAGAFQFAWHPDGKSLAAVCDGRTIQIWDVATGKPGVRLEGKTDGVVFAFNYAGTLLASTSWDGIPRLWDPRTGQQLFNTQASVRQLRFSRDDRLLAAGVSGENLQLFEVGLPLGYRTLVRAPELGRGAHHGGAVSPTLPLLAVEMSDGVGFWHLNSGAPLAFLPSPARSHILFAPSGNLLTNSEAGMLRWPIQESVSSTGSLTIGPPQKLALADVAGPMAQSRDGQVMAIVHGSGGLVWHLDVPGAPLQLSPHEDVRFISVSPDGRWVATGTHWGTKVKIWDERNRDLPRELPVETGSRVAFSSDGKWLATTGDGCRVWAVDTWQEGPTFGVAVAIAFSPVGSLLAIDTGYGVIRLVDPATGREYARLEDPNQDGAFCLCFSADGARLVAISSTSQSIHVWDLRTIRAELAQMELDWDLPPYPPAAPNDERPLQIEIDHGTLAQE